MASEWQDWLLVEYPDTSLTAATSLVIEQWSMNENTAAVACTAVTAYLEQQENPTGPLVYMGYNNPVLDAAAVCPVR